MSSWYQRKLFRYGLRQVLSRTGLVDDQTVDQLDADFSFGQKNVVTLRDVRLNVEQLSKYAHLPPCLRLETARVLLLRLTVPTDFYQSSIVVEIEGVEVTARLEEDEERPAKPESRRNRSPTTARTPQHRKTQRRLHLPPPYDPDGLPNPDQDLHIPTADEVAQSFLNQEPSQEREALEATLAAKSRGMEESFASESSDGGDIGTGTGLTIPGFLTSFFEGVVDRAQVHIKNVQIRIETDVTGETNDRIPLTLRLRVGAVDLDKLNISEQDTKTASSKRRELHVSDIALELLSNATVLADLSGMPSQSLSSKSRSFAESTRQSDESFTSAADGSTRRSSASTHRSSSHAMLQSSKLSAKSSSSRYPPLSPLEEPQASMATIDADRFADAGENESDALNTQSSDLDIHAGDDNISWASRRSRSSPPAENLWGSMVSDDLPDSLIVAPEQGNTSRTHSSRGSSPLATRERRVPWGPGSSPRWDESPQRHRQQQGPESWPALHHSQRSAIEPLDEELTAANEVITDNKNPAPEQAGVEEQLLEASSVSIPDMDDEEEDEFQEADEENTAGDMLESRISSRDEAQSMYMSAIPNSPKMHIPGGWGADTISEVSGPDKEHSTRASYASDLDGQASGNITPRAETPRLPTPLGNEIPGSQVVRELIYIDSISISVPEEVLKPKSSKSEEKVSPSIYGAQSAQAARAVPGAFSAYSESSRQRGASSIYGEVSSTLWATNEPEESTTVSPEPSVDVGVGTVRAQVDFATGRLLYAFAIKTASSLENKATSTPKSTDKTSTTTPKDAAPAFSLRVESLSISLKEKLDAEDPARDSASPSCHDIVNVAIEEIGLSAFSGIRLTVGALKVLLGGEDLLSFTRENSNLSNSLTSPPGTPDIDVTVHRDKTLANDRPVTEIVVRTAVIALLLDLPAINESFDSFGGLSGILELGSSILSESGASSPIATKTPKGVRFAGDADQPKTHPEVKSNVRIAGITITVKAASCYAVLKTSTVKAVHREAGIITTIERTSLRGPVLPNETSHAPISIELATARVEYILKPQEKDLERLLSLLTPSEDKYDSDDDILIDTLLRQRRKGGLLRIVVADVKVRVDNWDSLSVIEELGGDLARLSAVTKYLPEDDRPGMLTLLRIKDAEAFLPVNERFGTIRLALQDLHLAHVGLPALLAFSISNVKANQVNGPNLLHALVPLAGNEGLPMIMARMLGDEEEPTIKIKIFNACVEYSVPVLLDLTSMDKEVEVEEFVTGLTQSIAGLAMENRIGSQASESSGATKKKTHLSLLVHDSAIGLTPQKLQSKALLVLTDTHFTTVIPPEEILGAKLDLRKASIFITDNVVNHPGGPARAAGKSASTTQQLISFLSTQGFVSVGSIMSATISIRAADNVTNGSKIVEVDVKNELLLLETCADSTQTLLATLPALAPPTPPSKQPKYLTEPMTIEDMMASFTGDPFAKQDLPPETLFDVEADQEFEADMLLGGSGLSETADILAESTMTSSLIGPIMFGMDDNDEDGSTIGEDYPQTVESLLEEEDPFEMPTSPTDMLLDDAALLRDLKRQCKPTVRSEPIDLGLYEIEDLGYDALGSGQQALGMQQRFNAPFPGSRGGKKEQSNLPFRLRLRDCHVIWHIHDGYDWQRTRDGIAEAVEQFETKAEERRARRRQSLNDREDDESVVGDLLFNSIYIAVPSDHDAQDLRRQINRNIDDMISETESVPVSGMSRPTTYSASGQPRGQRKRRRLKLGRGREHKIAFELKGVSADVLVYPPGGGDVVSSVDVRVKDLEIFDKVPSSTWLKFLTHLETDSSTREMSKPMFHIQMDNVKTLESHSASEIVLKVSVLPLRLHVDQDALDFITRFFEFKDESAVSSGPPADPPFIQRVEIDTVDLCLDYKPKNIDYVGLRSGRTTEFMNFITLDASKIRLKHAIVYGLRGFDTLHQTLNDVWMPDIQRNQLPTILAGLAPVRSLVNLGSGVRDVVAIPIMEYKKDGRIFRSIQKGAFQFGKTTASELALLGAKVALGTQTALSNAEHFLSPEAATSSRRPNASLRTAEQGWQDIASDDEEPEQRAVSAYANQPLGVLPGLVSARRQLEHDLLIAKDALIAVRGEFFESRGPGGAAAAVARHAPTVILHPIIGATRAVGTTLLGVGNQIDRGNVIKMESKYKPR